MKQKTLNSKRITIYHVAKEANVSLATVSRVINNIGNVSPDTKMLVENAIKKLGYVPSDLARGLAKRQTTNVAIVLPSPNYSYISSMLSGMLDVCKIYGYAATLYTFEDPIDAAKVVDNVLSSQVEGIVVFNSELSAADLHKMMKVSLPIVLIGEDNYGDNALVDMNYSAVLEENVKRMIDRGVKKICYLKDPRKDWHMVNTFDKSLQRAVVDTGCWYELLFISDSYNVIYDHFMKHFAKNPPNHELYVTARDSLACAINNAAIDSGYKVPDDLETIGVVGTKQARMSRPTITSIDVDLYEVGSISMRMLTKMLQGTLSNKFFKFKTEYKPRNSTKD